MGKERTKKLVLSAMFMAMGLVLPFFTGQIHAIGKMLLPMHIPVLLCGLICGWPYGLVVGFILPLFRSLLFSMPVMYPNAIGMAFELATYGIVSGLLYRGKKGAGRLYKSIIISMISGRVVWGVAKGILLGMSGEAFTLSMFVQVALIEAIPGIILQLVLIPAIISALEYSKKRSEKKMTRVEFPYGKERLSYDFDEKNLAGVLVSKIHEYTPEDGQVELVKKALANPVGTEKLSELSVGKNKIVIIASDHTRPVPSKVIMPLMLSEMRKGNPDADITILIATGCHRGTTKEELVGKFGEEIVNNEKIYIHDCDERDKLVNIGTLPSGGECEINSLAINADLLVSEGFIEPHFFAGFSGGRKSVLPGIAGRKTVLANHCSEFIDSPYARTGNLEGNPIHNDMLWAAKTAKLAFIVNVIINDKKEVIYAVAGDVEKAHKKGADFLHALCGAKAVEADVAISTNGGYPLDQNVYQAVKGMTAAEATVKDGGVIIMLASSSDGHGGESFYHMVADEENIDKTMAEIRNRDRNETLPDQWEAQILIRIQQKASVIYVSQMPDEMVRNMHMTPAHSIHEALEKAKEILGKEELKIAAIPDGVSVFVHK